DEAVAGLSDRLDDARSRRVVFEDAAQLPNRAGEHVLRDVRALPDFFEELLFGHQLARPLDETREHPHPFRLQLPCRSRRDDTVELRAQETAFDPKIALPAAVRVRSPPPRARQSFGAHRVTSLPTREQMQSFRGSACPQKHSMSVLT